MAASVRVAAAIACALFSFLATNGSIYPGLVSIDPWVREWATLFGVVVLAALVVVARHRPGCLHPRLFNGIALLSVTGYLVLDSCGFAWASPVYCWPARCWIPLPRRGCSCWPMWPSRSWRRRGGRGGHDGVPVRLPAAALGERAWADGRPVAANAGCFAVLFLCVRPLVARPLQEAARSEPQAEMAVANPQSFLPTGHLLFVTIFVFSIAQGLVIALPGPFNDAPALPVAFIPLAVILVMYLARGRMPNADGLFALCALLIIAGMFLQPSDRVVSGGVASASNTLIDAGASCFNLLLVLLVGSIAGRNRVTALPTAALMLALYWSGVGVGAVLGNSAMTLLGWTEEALVWTSFASAMVFVAFCFVVLKNVSFVEAIGAIRSPEPLRPPAVMEVRGRRDGACGEGAEATRPGREMPSGMFAGVASTEEKCAAVGAEYGLTPREGEVFALLAQGRTVGVIREKLVISLNTARFHTKNIYVKLGVHSQQELIDVVEGFKL